MEKIRRETQMDKFYVPTLAYINQFLKGSFI